MHKVYGNRMTVYTKYMEKECLYTQSGCIGMREKLSVINEQLGFEELYIDRSCR